MLGPRSAPDVLSGADLLRTNKFDLLSLNGAAMISAASKFGLTSVGLLAMVAAAGLGPSASAQVAVSITALNVPDPADAAMRFLEGRVRRDPDDAGAHNKLAGGLLHPEAFGAARLS